jgi:hypothetical protein
METAMSANTVALTVMADGKDSAAGSRAGIASGEKAAGSRRGCAWKWKKASSARSL